MQAKRNGYRVGGNEEWFDDVPADPVALDKFCASARKRIEPWLSAIFQSEHFNLLLGSGFTAAVAHLAKAPATGMDATSLGTHFDTNMDAYATACAIQMGRGKANAEDQFRAALSLLEGLVIEGRAEDHKKLKTALSARMTAFLESLLATEAGIAEAEPNAWAPAVSALQSFLLSFASRSASRERLHVFTTNYDRLVEHGCDLAGLRVIDRFVGALEPVFRSSRVEVDLHYNPPGIRGEPRFMEGVIRLTKLHGSLDWLLDPRTRSIVRRGIPFGAGPKHPLVPSDPLDTVMIYPNAAKDVETTAYPYAELFRDMAAALCRPNSSVVLYGYGFGDDHVNRVLLDMLTIPSTHLVVLAYEAEPRLATFLGKAGRKAQISLLVGPHFAELATLVENYLPKPAIDHITGRVAELLKNRPDRPKDEDGGKPPIAVAADASDLI
ncbi:MAG: SIR2 family protein [Pseudomonadota bacterium]